MQREKEFKIEEQDIYHTSEKMVEQNKNKYNGVLILNQPYSSGLMGVRFTSKMYCFNKRFSLSDIEEERFSKLSKKKQVMELRAAIISITSIMEGLREASDAYHREAVSLGLRLNSIDPESLNGLITEKKEKV